MVPARMNDREYTQKYRSCQRSHQLLLNTLQAEMELTFKQIAIRTSIKSRVKSPESYYRKSLKILKGIRPKESRVFIPDILGMRIICPFLEDIQRVEMAIRNHYQVVEIERKRNCSFQEFGYESIHLLVTVPAELVKRHYLNEELICEIQIRTILQDAWAEVEHELVYKAGFSPFDYPLKRKLAALNANLTLSDIIFQEIRTYQRELQAELKRRRESFFKKVHQAISVRPDQEGADAVSFDSENRLDKTKKALPSLSPNSIDDLLLNALKAHNEGSLKQAIELYTHILHLRPEQRIQSLIYIHRGMAHFSESNYHEAIKDFSEALNLDSQSEKALYYRGLMYSVLKDYPAALKDFNHCLELNPCLPNSLFHRAQVYSHLGDFPRALADAKKALDIDPKLEEARSFCKIIRSRMTRGQ